MTINIPNNIDNITFNGNDLDELKVNGTTIWSSGIHPRPMYIESKQNGSTLTLSKTGSPSETYYISSDNKTAYHAYTYGTTITLNLGERLYWYSPTQAVHSDNNYVKFTMTGKFKVAGNIQSLNNYSTSVGDYGYYQLFYGCSAITDVSYLLLTATTVGRGGYGGMFSGCSNITTPPTISVTTFTGSWNCNQMFYQCYSLTTAPVLPATTLGQNCYNKMFCQCISLTTVPSNMLPATTLVSQCYYDMFSGCTSLTTAPVLPATTLAQQCYAGMFIGCYSLTTAPVLPATTLAQYCYQQMFFGCSSLTTVPSNMLPATTLASNCYELMFSGCSSLTTAPILPATTLVQNCYRRMFNYCTSLSSVIALFTDTPNYASGTSEWLYEVSATGTFTMSTDAQWNPEDYRGYNGIPTGWTVTTPMYIESKQNGSIVKLNKNGSPSETYYISSDNKTAYQAYTYGTSITLNAGDRLYWYSPTQAVHSSSDYVQFAMTGNFKVGGNIQSLNNYSTSVGDYGYYQLFCGCSAITDVSELELTATTVGHGGYSYMFYNCSGITTPPTISATTFTGTWNCSYMFYACTSLTTAPVLPATTVTSYCYYCMFQGCSSLTTVPSNMLPATTLSNNSYHDMFIGCSSLTASPEIPATTVAYWSCCGMFYGCTSMTTAASILPAITLAEGCYRGMYRDTGITASPILPAASVNETEGSSYRQMFQGSSSLSSITCYLENMPSGGMTNWVSGVSGTGTFTMSSNANWNPEDYRGESGVPVGWTVTTVTPQ